MATNIFIHRGDGSAGSGWATGTNAAASFFFCINEGNCGTGQRSNIATIAGGVCGRSGNWYWGRPVPLPSLNENPNVYWNLLNKPFRFRVGSSISGATMSWYVRVEYLRINQDAGFLNNVDRTI